MCVIRAVCVCDYSVFKQPKCRNVPTNQQKSKLHKECCLTDDVIPRCLRLRSLKLETSWQHVRRDGRQAWNYIEITLARAHQCCSTPATVADCLLQDSKDTSTSSTKPERCCGVQIFHNSHVYVAADFSEQMLVPIILPPPSTQSLPAVSNKISFKKKMVRFSEISHFPADNRDCCSGVLGRSKTGIIYLCFCQAEAGKKKTPGFIIVRRFPFLHMNRCANEGVDTLRGSSSSVWGSSRNHFSFSKPPHFNSAGNKNQSLIKESRSQSCWSGRRRSNMSLIKSWMPRFKDYISGVSIIQHCN